MIQNNDVSSYHHWIIFAELLFSSWRSAGSSWVRVGLGPGIPVGRSSMLLTTATVKSPRFRVSRGGPPSSYTAAEWWLAHACGFGQGLVSKAQCPTAGWAYESLGLRVGKHMAKVIGFYMFLPPKFCPPLRSFFFLRIYIYIEIRSLKCSVFSRQRTCQVRIGKLSFGWNAIWFLMSWVKWPWWLYLMTAISWIRWAPWPFGSLKWSCKFIQAGKGGGWGMYIIYVVYLLSNMHGHHVCLKHQKGFSDFVGRVENCTVATNLG